MVSNSASVALAPLLAIWLTKSFQPWASSFCWAAISGEWHWAQTRTITSRPGPSGSALKSSAKAGLAAKPNKTTAPRIRTSISLFCPIQAQIDLLLWQSEGDDLIIGNHRTGLGPAGVRHGDKLPAVRPLVGGRGGRDGRL